MARTSLEGEERRDLTVAAAEVGVTRADADAPLRFTGHAAVFNTRAAIGNPATWGFYEEFAPGSFTKTLAEGDARMLIDHDPYYVVSRVSADTLSLRQDGQGLAVDSALEQRLSYVNDLIVNLEIQNIRGMSFGFYVIKDDWSQEEIEVPGTDPITVDVRVVREVKLLEVSAVTFPAFPETDAGLRHSLVPALRRRGDPEAIARTIRYRPELAELLGDIDREPGGSTRGDVSTTDPTVKSAEPAEPTRVYAPSIADLNAAAARRYGLKVA